MSKGYCPFMSTPEMTYMCNDKCALYVKAGAENDGCSISFTPALLFEIEEHLSYVSDTITKLVKNESD